MTTSLKPSYALSSRWIRACLLGLLLLASTAPALAQAPPSTTTIAATTHVVAQFPTALTFRLNASSSQPITSAVLRYRLERLSCFEELVDRHPDFTPSPQLEVSWSLDMRKIGGLPPGTPLRFQWLLENAAGHRQATPEETLSFDDPRYPWRSLRQGMVTLRWYRGSEAFASRLLAAAGAALERLARETGTRLERPAQLYIYESAEALRQARIFPQTWEGGVAFPSYGIVAIGVAPEQVAWGEGAVAHELAHLGVYQMSFNCYQDLPTWLNEGLASYAEGEPSPEQHRLLEQAIANNQLISVRSLSSSFPADPRQARLSYTESRSLVAFLIGEYGQEKLLALVDWLRRGYTYDRALLQTYGVDTQGLEAAWRRSIGAPPPLATATPAPRAVPTATPTPTPAPTPTAAPAPPPLPDTTSPPAISATPTPLPPTRPGFSCARRGAAGAPGASDLGALVGATLLLALGVGRWTRRGGRS